jgi:tetratricopeptide (TPR) repeat protein
MNRRTFLITAAISVTAASAAVDELEMRHLDRMRTLLDRHRYTREPQLLRQARAGIDAALSRHPGDFNVRKLDLMALLAEERYPQARDAASALLRKAPDDVELYGFFVDAAMVLGAYDEAEKQANWMLRLRPQHRESLRRAAELRAVFGDTEGAVLMLQDLFRFTPAGEPLARAWVLARIADLANDRKIARQALALAPESADAALVANDAASLDALVQRTGCVQAMLQLAVIQGEFTAFVQSAAGNETASAQVARIEYLLDHAHRPGEALALVETHVATYRNTISLSWYAAALAKNGKTMAARKVAAEVTTIGTRNRQVLARLQRVKGLD